MIKYSFIIPVKEINNYIKETVEKISLIQRDDWEVIIYPDQTTADSWPRVRQIASGPGGPALKRNLAIADALGDFLIFIDDDAYPREDFLEKLDEDFKDPGVVATGGPAMTPATDSFWQKVSGAVFLSSFSGGYPERYASVGTKKFIDDWPSVNLTVRKKDFAAVKGFNCGYWPGEDTKLCLDLLKESGGQIIYDPALVAYHHRRGGLLKHLKQIGGYGIHRGFFAKKFPETSWRWKYFIPSLFLLFVIGGGIAAQFSEPIRALYLVGWLIYLLGLIKAAKDIYQHEKNLLIILNALYYIFLTHLYYGWRFIQGLLFTRELKSKLR